MSTSFIEGNVVAIFPRSTGYVETAIHIVHEIQLTTVESCISMIAALKFVETMGKLITLESLAASM
jgi:hypothetical protein